jgi:DNA-binding NarL/FixJ family response regulator
MRILLVDAHPMIHEVLGGVVRAVFSNSTLLVAHDLTEAFEHAQGPGGVDLALLDLSLPGCTGIEALARFLAAFPGIRVVVVSSAEDHICIRRALELGAVGYVPKTYTAPLIAAALRVVSAGGAYVPPEALKAAPGEPRAANSLTGRQLDVIRLIAKGFPNKEIATHLMIAEDTVKHHACMAYLALGISSRTQVVAAASRHGIKLD